MSLKHLPKTYVNISDKENSEERQSYSKLNRKARKIGFKNFKDFEGFVSLHQNASVQGAVMAKSLEEYMFVRKKPYVRPEASQAA